MGWLDRKAKGNDSNPYLGLRRQALTLDPKQVGLASSPEHPQVFAGFMEMGIEGGVATLVVIADGTTSMYWSTGGGIIGAGFHEQVKGPSRAFLAILERHISEMTPDGPDHPLPTNGMTHLRARTFSGGCPIAAALDRDFAEKRHPLWEAFYAAHAVIGAMRQVPAVKNAQLGK